MSFDRGSYRRGKTILDNRDLRTRYRADPVPGSAVVPPAGRGPAVVRAGGTIVLQGMPRSGFPASSGISVFP